MENQQKSVQENVLKQELISPDGLPGRKRAEKKSFFSTRSIAIMAIFTALSFVLYMYVKFPMPLLFPAFLDFQVSDLPALICGFTLGPLQACIVLVLKTALKLPFSGTMFVGELADLLIGLAFVLPSGLIYQKRKNMKGAILGASVGVITSTVTALLANYFILVPFYVEFFYKGNWDILLNSVRPLYKNVTKESFYLFYLSLGILPFNLLRGILTSVLTLLSFNSISRSAKFIFRK